MSLYPYRDSHYQRRATSAVWGCGNTGTATHCQWNVKQPGCGKHPAVPQKLSSLGQHLHSWVYTQESRNLCSNKSLNMDVHSSPTYNRQLSINTTQNAICIYTKKQHWVIKANEVFPMTHHGPSQKILCRVKASDRTQTAESHSKEISRTSNPETKSKFMVARVSGGMETGMNTNQLQVSFQKIRECQWSHKLVNTWKH